MKSLFPLLQISLNFSDYKFALLSFITAFVVAMVSIPPVIRVVNRFKLFDVPDSRKEHSTPTPTLGGIAIIAGMTVSLLLWFPGQVSSEVATCFFSMAVLFGMGITDDLKDLSAKYKFVVEIALAGLIALAGVRITTFGGLFGLNELPLSAQYTFTVLAIVGITNAFNLIDGIDGLAGGLSFMSLVTLGLFLTMSGDPAFALIAFALAGGVLAFLYFNMNPAKIFMGDTGSLVLGFVIAILCTRLIQVNSLSAQPVLKNAPLFAFGMVLIPVFDTMRVFALRIWKGKSPFDPDRTHIHHLMTNVGFSHSFTSKVICVIHGFFLIEVYWLKDLRPEIILLVLISTMILVTAIFYNMHLFKKPVLPAPMNDLELN
jgi:UDP-N-acetylmuramyl pentapeptide phosphotransferase/UDP-N-acetylglucosamine-1-phosphate transferase